MATETDVSDPATEDRGELPALPRFAVDLGLVTGGLAFGYFLANRLETKKNRWNDKLAGDECPWCSRPIVRPEDRDPLWYCSWKPDRHNENRKPLYFLF